MILKHEPASEPLHISVKPQRCSLITDPLSELHTQWTACIAAVLSLSLARSLALSLSLSLYIYIYIYIYLYIYIYIHALCLLGGLGAMSRQPVTLGCRPIAPMLSQWLQRVLSPQSHGRPPRRLARAFRFSLQHAASRDFMGTAVERICHI